MGRLPVLGLQWASPERAAMRQVKRGLGGPISARGSDPESDGPVGVQQLLQLGKSREISDLVQLVERGAPFLMLCLTAGPFDGLRHTVFAEAGGNLRRDARIHHQAFDLFHEVSP